MDYPRGTMRELTLFSQELNESLQLLVYLPASFSPLYKYSLLIAQDGQDYFQLGQLARVADQYLFAKEIENIIIVGVPYKNVEDRFQKYHPNGVKNKQYIRFLAHELAPYLDQVFPTYQIGSTRALIGDSLGGTISLITSLLYPHTFGKVILQSPFVNDQVIELVKNMKEPQLLTIYHVIGKQETSVPTTDGLECDFLSPNRELADVITQKAFTYFYDEFDGNHTWTYWQPDLKCALKTLF